MCPEAVLFGDFYREIIVARERIAPNILRTPLLQSRELGMGNQSSVFMKLENEQHTGSFKVRGALNKVFSVPPEEREAGFVCASSGNHGLGFSLAMGITGSAGTVYLPKNADKSKVQALQNYEVALEFYGDTMLQTELHAKEQARASNQIWISPYNDPMVIAGQGTIGMEITEDLTDIDCVLACVGGGGLMSGIASWISKESPKTQIIGCLPENSPELYMSVRKGEIVTLEHPKDTLSDGSAGGLEPGAITFDLCRELIDDYILVSEDEIAGAIKFMAETHHMIIEGSAGVALGAFRKKAGEFGHKNVVIVICGGNISEQKLKGILGYEWGH